MPRDGVVAAPVRGMGGTAMQRLGGRWSGCSYEGAAQEGQHAAWKTLVGASCGAHGVELRRRRVGVEFHGGASMTSGGGAHSAHGDDMSPFIDGRGARGLQCFLMKVVPRREGMQRRRRGVRGLSGRQGAAHKVVWRGVGVWRPSRGSGDRDTANVSDPPRGYLG